ncbi:phosphotransferase [Paenibacillus protaetiae]|uniref:Aminoglycoside phosphotransferase domain-containing protein n=1 Tax=Paenibacillus protaetiae TaxID=2509456 RepID=A0A4P6ETN5_9BACL|nr:phosphotransferase [Paenibacillus protaetiae]QAY66006.1 hypothetical protein ET464_05985 [Paenibacillus protaetiae]
MKQQEKKLQHHLDIMLDPTQAEIESALSYYSLGGRYKVEERDSGMNNTTRLVTCEDGSSYMLRIYKNHCDQAVVELEHEILTALNESAFPLYVPVPVANGHGNTVTATAGGALAALCRYIPGSRPTVRNDAQLYSLGKAAGQLSRAFAELQVNGRPLYDPYYLLPQTYKALEGTDFQSLAAYSPKLLAGVEALTRLQHEREAAGKLCEAAKALPPHWIHGDLVMNNTVAAGDEIIGLLDFEFSTVDIRPMELAVTMGDLVQAQADEALERIKLYCRGFRSVASLSDEEAGLIPGLIKLRMLDVSLHFTNRFQEGLDPVDVLEGIVLGASGTCSWINRHERQLVSLLSGS